MLKVLEAEEKTASGIVLPDTAKEKPQQGKVLAVGLANTVKTTMLPMSVKEGDTVLFAKYAGTEVKHNGEELLILRESDLLAIIG